MRAIEGVMLASCDPNVDRFDAMSSLDASWSGSGRDSAHTRIELQLSGHRVARATVVGSILQQPISRTILAAAGARSEVSGVATIVPLMQQLAAVGVDDTCELVSNVALVR